MTSKNKKTTTMTKVNCANCGVEGDKNMMCCSRCKGTNYCSSDCQKSHWKQHKKICKLLNVGAAAQVKLPGSIKQTNLFGMPDGLQQAWEVFMSGDTSEKAVKQVNSLLSRIPLEYKGILLKEVSAFMMEAPASMLKLPTSPFLVLLSMDDVDPDGILADCGMLHFLAVYASNDDLDSHIKQKIMAKQVIKAGANPNLMAASGETALSIACQSTAITSLHFIKVLLDHGADANLANNAGFTPLMGSVPFAMGAAKYLLTYPSVVPIEINKKAFNGSTFLGCLRNAIKELQHNLQFPSTAEELQIKRDVLLPQLLEVEQLAVKKGAKDDTHVQLPSSVPKVHVDNSLPYDIGVLLGVKNLLLRGPEWYQNEPFAVYDDLAQCRELFCKSPHLHGGRRCSEVHFETLKPPAVGQTLDIKAYLPGGPGEVTASPNSSWFALLTGEVTEIFPPPKEKRLRGSGSLLYKKNRQNYSIEEQKYFGYTDTGSYAELLDVYGFVHGQQVKGIVELCSHQGLTPKPVSFFRGFDSKFEVLLQCNDHKRYKWEVIGIDLADGGTAK